MVGFWDYSTWRQDNWVMVILQRIYRNSFNRMLPYFGLQYSTVGELRVMVILHSLTFPVFY